MAQRLFVEDNVEAVKELGYDPDEFQSVKGIKKFKHQIETRGRGFTGASIQSIKTPLTLAQLKQCGNEYINNGMVRQCVNKLDWHLLGERTKFLIKPNNELTEFVEREKLSKTITDILGEPENRVEELQQKLLRVDKRVELGDRLHKLVKPTLIFGRNFLGIERFPKTRPGQLDSNGEKMSQWLKFGEPKSLKPMNSTRIVDVKVNDKTYEFEGYYYDFGLDQQRKELIEPIDMIPLWNDDDNILDMTYYSGTSLVWPILSVAQAIDVMNDEDVPEYVKRLYRKFGDVMTGTSDSSVNKKIAEKLEDGTMLVHGRKELKINTHDLSGGLMDIMNGRESSSKFIAWSMAIPLFIIFEDTANFATANQALQAFKVGTLNRMRTWIQNALEKYWYNPMLADHLNIDLEDVIAARIQVKAIIEDIIYDTPGDIALKEVALVGAGIHTPEQALENMGEDKFLEEMKRLKDEKAKAKEDAIREAQRLIAANGINPQNPNDPTNTNTNGGGNPNANTNATQDNPPQDNKPGNTNPFNKP